MTFANSNLDNVTYGMEPLAIDIASAELGLDHNLLGVLTANNMNNDAYLAALEDINSLEQ